MDSPCQKFDLEFNGEKKATISKDVIIIVHTVENVLIHANSPGGRVDVTMRLLSCCRQATKTLTAKTKERREQIKNHGLVTNFSKRV